MNIRTLAAVLIATILLATACSSEQPKTQSANNTPAATATSVATATPAPTNTPQVVASPTPTKSEGGAAISEDDFKKIATAWSAAKSYRMESSLSGGASGTIEVVRPDREHIKMDIAGRSMEVIRIGSDTYSNITGQWTKTTGSGTGIANIGTDPEALINGFNNAAAKGETITKGASVVIDGVPCQEWVMQTATASGNGSMFVGTTDYLPRQFKSADGDLTVTFTDWNAPITINPPM